MTGGGVFVLGQEQDEPGGRFHPVQSFIGEMTQLNVWSAAFTGDEIYNISRSCEVADSKAVIRWPAFLGGTKGNVMTGVPHFCEGLQSFLVVLKIKRAFKSFTTSLHCAKSFSNSLK